MRSQVDPTAAAVLSKLLLFDEDIVPFCCLAVFPHSVQATTARSRLTLDSCHSSSSAALALSPADNNSPTPRRSVSLTGRASGRFAIQEKSSRDGQSPEATRHRIGSALSVAVQSVCNK